MKKSKKEIKEQFDGVKKKRDLKAERKRIQDENVKRKQAEKEAKEGTKEGDDKKKKVGFKGDGESESDAEDYKDAQFDEQKDARALPKSGKFAAKVQTKKNEKFVGGKRKLRSSKK